MSSPTQKADSSLNNLPEKNNNAPSGTIGTAGGSTNLIGTGKSTDASTSLDTVNNDTQEKAPIDKHGDSWGGGIPHVNKQCI
ncbi:unnamed protein product [Adineta ricciae]|uniref:Uncharacterized protein n=1 Tax=Adineta ricciae TaxID=249248 RepID=A0A814D397_ADIRI|nr:unnamed protein product [Adineta ricciae]CAF1428649.1 unnamed protein product [Adineta ricciae]